MPRNGSGIYTLPAGNPVVTGTTISSTVQNNTMADVATALTGSLARDGQSPPTANLPMGGYKLTGLTAGSNSTDSATFGQTVNAPTTVTLPSDSTVNIGAELTTNIAISGTTTITAFDTVAEGVTRTVVYTGAVPVTHNATSLILLGGASRTHAAGDVSVFKSLGSGNWKEIDYAPIGALPLANGGTGGTTAATARASLGVPLAGYLSPSATLSNNATDATNDIDIAAGSAASDSATPDLMVLGTALTKRLDATWAVGANQGGLDTGTVADGTYHVFLIKRSDTGVVDVLFSASPSAPTMPANYDSKRRIGSILRESGVIVPFNQYGDVFKRKTQVEVRRSTTPVSNTLLYMKVPAGIKVAPLFVADCQLSSAGSLIQLMGDGDAATAEVSVNRVAGTEFAVNLCTGHFITNTAGQLRFTLLNSSGTATEARIQSQGWIDGRGR